MATKKDVKTAGYQWTNHPLVDMGIASLMIFAGREEPGDLTYNDLERFACYAEHAFFSPELASYLTVLFTSNGVATNPSVPLEKRKKNVARLLRVFRENSEARLPQCAYCGGQSVRLAHRDLIPMVTGRDHVNFSPDGAPGLALCGNCILALQALTVGAPMCGGRALIVSCDDPKLTVALVRTWQPEIRKRIQLSEQSGQKRPPVTRPLTRVLEALIKIEAERKDKSPSSLTVYHLSNSGQGPQADIYFLPSTVVRFVERARLARYSAVWKELVRRAWEVPAKPKKGQKDVNGEKTVARNYLYEDLFGLPDQASHFIRVYFLRKATTYSQGSGDPRPGYCGWEEYLPGIWDITKLFLQEVVAMDAARIESIRKLGDVLADEIASENDRRFWECTYMAKNYLQVRLLLIQGSRRRLKRGLAPILSFDEFLEIFEEGEELPRVDWRLAWDLVLIRIIEKLYEAKWFEKNREVLESPEEVEQIELKEA